jgi:hypothetical protein
VGSFTDSSGEEVERTWSKPFYNFDSFIEALLSLFVGMLLSLCHAKQTALCSVVKQEAPFS